jgi:hypothetical protein
MAITATEPMSAVFVGHGNFMNIVGRNRWTEGHDGFGRQKRKADRRRR